MEKNDTRKIKRVLVVIWLLAAALFINTALFIPFSYNFIGLETSLLVTFLILIIIGGYLK